MHAGALAGIETGVERQLAHTLLRIAQPLALHSEAALRRRRGAGELEFAGGLSAQVGPQLVEARQRQLELAVQTLVPAALAVDAVVAQAQGQFG
ncbi:hypothetical protein D3C78_945890 [compost metagenome]